MRGHWLSTTRRLNRHYQSGGTLPPTPIYDYTEEIGVNSAWRGDNNNLLVLIGSDQCPLPIPMPPVNAIYNGSWGYQPGITFADVIMEYAFFDSNMNALNIATDSRFGVSRSGIAVFPLNLFNPDFYFQTDLTNSQPVDVGGYIRCYTEPNRSDTAYHYHISGNATPTAYTITNSVTGNAIQITTDIPVNFDGVGLAVGLQGMSGSSVYDHIKVRHRLYRR